MREAARDYVFSCSTCQRFNYQNASLAGNLTRIKLTYPLENVGVDLIAPYPLFNPGRFRYVLVITAYFNK